MAPDPDMHSNPKGNRWHFGVKHHIGVDSDFGLVHTVRGSPGSVRPYRARGAARVSDQRKSSFV